MRSAPAEKTRYVHSPVRVGAGMCVYVARFRNPVHRRGACRCLCACKHHCEGHIIAPCEHARIFMCAHAGRPVGISNYL